MSLRQAVERFIDRHDLLTPDATVVVGVSGGPDSMALLHFLNGHKEKWRLTLVACCVDHMLRGKESEDDVTYVRDFCLKYDLLFYSEQVDVPSFKKKNHTGTQDAARICRYQVFERAMKMYHAQYLALAHHGDDQIETMLMQETRGLLGVYGAGIPVKRPFGEGEIIRPFLTVTKQQIEDYCQMAQIAPKRDKSNNSDRYTRNRFRQHVLPFLKEENPQVHLRFQQASEQMTEDHTFLMSLAEKVYNDVILDENKYEIQLSVEKLLAIPLSLQRRIIHLILSYLYTTSYNTVYHQAIHIDSFLQWLKKGHTTGQFHLPHQLMIYRSYEVCTFIFKNSFSDVDLPYNHPLIIPGVTETPAGVIIARLTEELDNNIKGINSCVLDYDTLSLPLTIRSKKPGDRLHPKGLKGTQKLKSIFINAKINPDRRKAWPVVVDGQGTILWLPGLRHSENAAYQEQKKKYLILTFSVNEEHGGKQYEK